MSLLHHRRGLVRMRWMATDGRRALATGDLQYGRIPIDAGSFRMRRKAIATSCQQALTRAVLPGYERTDPSQDGQTSAFHLAMSQTVPAVLSRIACWLQA